MRFRRLLKIFLSLLSLFLSTIYTFVSVQILKNTSSIQLTQDRADLFLVLFALIILSCIILYFITRKIISFALGMGILSFGIMLGVFYLVAWGRFFLSHFYHLFWGLAFGANHFITISFFSVLFVIFLFFIYKQEGLLGIFTIQMSAFITYIIVGYKYNVPEVLDKKILAQYGAVQIMTNYVAPDEGLINLGSQRDIRYITFSKEGILYGCGGNQSYNSYEKNIFKFQLGKNDSLKTFDSIEVKYLSIDEKRREIYAPDFQSHTLYKLSMEDLTLIKSEYLGGLSPQIISQEDSEHIYLVYDQPLVIEQRMKDDLSLVRRLDVYKSEICNFGSIGISIAFSKDDNLIAAFINCNKGLIELDQKTLLPIRLLSPEDSVMWYVTSSKDRKNLYIAYPLKDFIAEIDSVTLNTKRHIHAGYGIRYILESLDSTRLFAADYHRGTIYIIDKASGLTLAKYRFGRKTYAIAEHPVNKKLYIAGPAGIWELDIKR